MIESVGQYKILEPLGRSALGDVYRARDLGAGRTVAVTIAGSDVAASPERRRQFLADARRAASLSHPNIAAVYEVTDQSPAPYLVTEFVPGQALASLVSGQALNPRKAVEYAAQMADALAFGHAHGIPHGALHPDHIVITPKGSAKIPQFGLAAWTNPSATSDEAGDLWALGLVLYQMLTGKQPQPGWPAPAPTSINRSLPREVDPIVGRLLAMDLKDRYTSAATVAAELRELATRLEARARTAEPVAPARRQAKRPAAIWIALIVVALAIVAAVLLFGRVRP
jgi:serine/threonine-protein kinase